MNSSSGKSYHSGGFTKVASEDDAAQMSDHDPTATTDHPIEDVEHGETSIPRTQLQRKTSIEIQGEGKPDFRISLSYVNSSDEDEAPPEDEIHVVQPKSDSGGDKTTNKSPRKSDLDSLDDFDDDFDGSDSEGEDGVDDNHELDGYERYLRQIGAAVQSAPDSDAFAVPGQENHRNHSNTTSSGNGSRRSSRKSRRKPSKKGYRKGRRRSSNTEDAIGEASVYGLLDNTSSVGAVGSKGMSQGRRGTHSSGGSSMGPIVYVKGNQGGVDEIDDESVTFLTTFNRGKRKLVWVAMIGLAVMLATIVLVVIPKIREEEAKEAAEEAAEFEKEGETNSVPGPSLPSSTEIDSHEHNESIMALLQEVSKQEDLENKSSPQRYAVKWLIDDPYLSKLFHGAGNDSNKDEVVANADAIINSGSLNDDIRAHLKQTVLERYALATFYYATEGPPGETHVSENSGWKNAANWLSYEKHVCTWKGVVCDGEKEEFQLVKELKLVGNGLGGEIPDEVGVLMQLVKLDLSHNQISGGIPQGMSKLVRLTDLRLAKNQLSGSLDPAFFDNIQTFEVLILDENNFSGPIPATIAKSLSLFLLRLGGNDLSGPIPHLLGSLKFLFELDLTDNKLSGVLPSELGQLLQLQQLRLGRNDFTGPIPESFGQLGELVDLEMDGNALTGVIPDFFGGGEGGEISNPGAGTSIKSLKTLYLDGNMFHGSIPSSLSNLLDLSELTLEDNNLTGEVPPLICNLGLRLFSTDCEVMCECCTVRCFSANPLN